YPKASTPALTSGTVAILLMIYMRSFITLFCLVFLTSSLYSTDNKLHDFLEKAKDNYHNSQLTQSYLFTGGEEIAEYVDGDEKLFWRWNLTVMPPRWVQENTYCVGVGEHSYLFVAMDQLDVSFFESDVDSIMQYLEEKTFASNEMGIIETVVNNFGEIPDAIDNDPKIVIYYSPLGSYSGSVFNGYFSVYNQMTESEASMMGHHSNECEMLYMSCSPVKPAARINISVLAHELQHLIHWGKDPNEEQWVNEGCSQYAMVLCGLPDPIQDFQNNPNNSLFKWNKKYSDLVKVMLFFTYLAEQYGGAEMIKDLVANIEPGVVGIVSTLNAKGYDVEFKDIFTNWAIANFIDDSDFAGGKYGYDEFDLPAFKIEQKFTDFPVLISGNLASCATNYYELPTDFVKLELAFDFPGFSKWSTSLIAYENNEPKEVIVADDGNINFKKSTEYDLSKLVLVVSRTGLDTGTVNFSFNINNITGVDDNENLSSNYLNIFPNPVYSNTTVQFSVNTPGTVTLKVYDYLGREVKELLNSFRETGTYTFNTDLSGLPSGAYYIRLIIGGIVETKKVTVF
ncbi:T9SS type A sorting domain-containing protein, partial [Bacteroidota bacterium]